MVKKEKNNNLWYILGGAVIIILILLVLSSDINKPSVKEELTSEDFEIISAGWNVYQTRYDQQQSTYVPDESLPKINWSYYCSGLGGDGWEELSNWHFTTHQSENLLCVYYYDGIRDELHNDGSRSLFNTGVLYQGMGSSLDYKEDHELMICCTSDSKDGEVCDSINLPARC